MDSKTTVGPYTHDLFHPNIKCIIFSAIMIILYWYLPNKRNVYIIPLIFIFSYVTMAWYDHIYKCNRKLYTGSFPDLGTILDSIFKPQSINKDDISSEDINKLLPEYEQKKAYQRNVYLFHLLVIVPILIYIGYNGNKTDKRLYGVLLGFGILAGIYHGYRLINPRI